MCNSLLFICQVKIKKKKWNITNYTFPSFKLNFGFKEQSQD